MTVVDTSVWVSYFIPQDVNHITSQLWVQSQLSNNQILLGPNLVLPEVGGAIARRFGQSQAREAVQYLKLLPLLFLIQLDDTISTTSTELAISLNLRGADSVYVSVAQQFYLPLITWDNEILKRAGSVIQLQTP